MVSAVERYEAAYKRRDELKGQLREKTRRMLRVLQALQTEPPAVAINAAPADYSHAVLMFADGDTFHSNDWLTVQELAKVMAAVPVAERAVRDTYDLMSEAERRHIPLR